MCYLLQASCMTASPGIFSSFYLVLKSIKQIEHYLQSSYKSRLNSILLVFTSFQSSSPRDIRSYGLFLESSLSDMSLT